MTRARNSANLASHGNLFVDITNDRTGIGSVVPAQNLHVAGTAGFHADVTFTGDLYNTSWDRSDNSLKFVDGAKAKFGTSQNLQIYYDGSSYITNSTAGHIIIKTINGGSDINLECADDFFVKTGVTQNSIIARDSGQVELFYSGNEKFETTAYGTNTTGTAVNDGLVVAGVATVTTMNVTGVLTYDDVTSVDSVGIVTARQGIHIDDSIVHIGDTNTRIRFPDADTITAETAGDERFRITSDGKVGINSTSPSSQLEIHTDASAAWKFRINTSVSDGAGFYQRANGDFEMVLRDASNNNNNISGSAGGLQFTTANSERFRITSTGALQHTAASGLSYFTGSSEYIIGSQYSSPSSGGKEADFQVHNNKSRATVSINGYANNAGAPILQFVSSRSNTKGVLGTKAVNGDYIGDIRFFGDNGTNGSTLVQSAAIQTFQRSNISDGDTVAAGEISFSTGTATGGSLTEKLKITSGGQIGITKTPKEWNTSYRSLQIHDAGYIAGSTDDSFVAIGANNYLDTSGNYDYTNSDFASQLYQVDGTLVFRNAASGTADNAITWSEKFHITSDGKIGINRTPSSHPLEIQHASDPTVSLWRGSTKSAALQAQSGGTYLYSYENAPLIFSVNSAQGFTDRLRINSTGDIGINYSGTPNGTLDIRTDRDPSNGLMCFIRNNTQYGNGAFYGMDVNSVGTWSIGMPDNTNVLSFRTGGQGNSGTEYLRIESGGGLKFTGQGTSIPVGGILHHTNNNLYVRGGTNGLILGNQDNTNTMQIYNGYIKFETNNGTEKLRITSTGAVNIGGNYTQTTYQFSSRGGAVDQSAQFSNTKSNNGDIHYIGITLTNSGYGQALFGHTGHTTAGSQAAWMGLAGDDVAGGVGVKCYRGGTVQMGASSTLQAFINNSVSGHQFISQCSDNNNGFEIYQKHGSTSTRNTLAVYNNTGANGAKHLNFYVRGDNQVHISGNKQTTGLVMDGTSAGTANGETGNTIDFHMLNEANQFTGNPAARIASFLERGNNGFGLKFYARNSAGTFASMVQLSADYRWEPTLDMTVDLGSSSNSWRKAYIMNAYPDHSSEQATSGSSFSSSTYYDTGFSRGSMGGLDTNGTYIITLFADTYAAGGGNYSCNYTWIVGMRNQSTNQSTSNSVPLLSVTGHSTNGVLFELRTKRYASVHGGDEVIQWRCTSNLSEINNNGGRLMRWRAQRIGRTSDS